MWPGRRADEPQLRSRCYLRLGSISFFLISAQTFPERRGKWQPSTAGGRQPRWRADGKELYFVAPDSKMMAVTVAASGAELEVGKAVALFSTNIPWGSDKAQYAVARDGRFLINQTRDHG